MTQLVALVTLNRLLELTQQQYERIRDALPVQRGNVTLGNRLVVHTALSDLPDVVSHSIRHALHKLLCRIQTMCNLQLSQTLIVFGSN
ncbi:MAG: hypothetical protein RL211_2367 [Pseudomonadota bacterium]